MTNTPINHQLNNQPAPKPFTIHKADFITSAPSLSKSPNTEALAEYAFVGRSNVGKSSLINSLLQRKQLAKTSNTPGKTRLLNFYAISLSIKDKAGELQSEQFYFVDLPGYGYAKVSKTEQQAWAKELTAYLKRSDHLQKVIVLIDGRLPLQESDAQMIDWLIHHNRPFMVIPTKLDKLGKQEATRQINALTAAIHEVTGNINVCPIIPYSSQTHLNREALWKTLLDS